jgi:tRNA A-37 threonylcarbamoyl transferase component Bud32
MRLPDPQRSRVVLIGTSKYEDEKLPDLPAVSRSIEDLAAQLIDPDYGLVPENHCAVLLDEGDIRLVGRCLRQAARQAQDLLLVYYAGHGLVGGRRHDLYLALSDSEWVEPEFNSLEYDKLRSAVLDSPAATKVIVLDCCFSGRVVTDTMADPVSEIIRQVEVDGTYVLASAHRDQVALILPGEDYTAFTGRLLGLLHNGIPGGPELLTIGDLYRHLLAKMEAEGLPRPQKRGTDSADSLALARNRAFASLPGQVVGYRMEGQVGQGAMAVVYRAYDPRLERSVALKVLDPALAHDTGFRQRFIRESRAAAAVDHPNIIPIYEAGEAGGVLFIAMRLVEGQDIRTLIDQQGQLPVERVCDVVAQVASALDAAHRHGLVHGNVNPSNILREAMSGRAHPDHVYLSGFGLSKLALGGASGDSLTSTGQFLGSLHYAVPEQVQGRTVDGRTDEYALASSAFEMLAGQPPFRGDEAVAVIWASLSNRPPSLTSMRPDLHVAVDRVMARALAKAPEDRYSTCLEFADALRQAAELG